MHYEIPCSRDKLLQGIFLFLKLIKKIKVKRLAFILSIDRLGRNYYDVLGGDTIRYAILGEDNETNTSTQTKSSLILVSNFVL